MISSWRDRWSIIIDKLKTVHSVEESEALLKHLSEAKGARILAFVNSHALNCVAKDESFFDALSLADDLLIDGTGMAILFRMHGRSSGLNMNGTDFIPLVLGRFEGKKVAIWGTAIEYVNVAAQYCKSEFGNSVISTEDGFHEPEFYLNLAKELQPDLILLGMGMPKQERLAKAIRMSGSVDSLIVCGGAIIDFMGKKSVRAPRWVRSIGFEWVFRFMLEPRRLFRRYVLGNPLFLIRALILKKR